MCAIAFYSGFAYADVITLQPGLTLEQNFNTYIIHFTMPDYEIVDDVISDINNDYIFSLLKPGNDYFDHIDEDGRPSLPFYSLHMLIPFDASWTVTNVITTTDVVHLDYDYIPAQSHQNSDNILSFDEDYYSNYNISWHWDEYEAHTTGFGCHRGISFSFFPCHYEPSEKALTIVTEATYEISCSNHFLPIDLLENAEIIYPSMGSLYDNAYHYNTETTPESIYRNKYLIITTDEWYGAESLTNFISHKQSLGYSISVERVGEIENTPDSIRSCIKSHYENEGLDYVLLVGDVNEIPFSSGEIAHNYNPPTDIFYACLDSSTIQTQDKDLSPDVCVGRWPINTEEELQSIVLKTMHSDSCLGMNDPDRIAIFTGGGTGEEFFYEDGLYLYDSVVCNVNYPYTGTLFDGRNLYVDSYTMFNELNGLNEEPTWLMVYTGHGAIDCIGSPYNITSSNLNDGHISTSNLPYQSYGFMFACQIGNIYEENNFAKKWIGVPDGGTTLWASTTNSFYDPDRYLSRAIFNQLKRPVPMTIGEFVSFGTAKYYNACMNAERFAEAKRYVLYGDPSLYLFGLNLYSQQQLYGMEFANNLNSRKIIDQKKDYLLINSEDIDNLLSLQLYSLTGQLLLSSKTDELNLHGLAHGIYLLVVNEEKQSKTYPIIVK